MQFAERAERLRLGWAAEEHFREAGNYLLAYLQDRLNAQVKASRCLQTCG
jgi:hypothetical protein